MWRKLGWMVMLVLLVGCSGKNRRVPLGATPLSVQPAVVDPIPSHAPTVQTQEPVPSLPVVQEPAPPALTPAPSPSRPSVTAAPPVARGATNSFLSAIVWTSTNGLGATPLTLLAGGFGWSMPHGRLELKPGAPAARWDGVGVLLGMPPRLTFRGEFQVGSVDLNKLCAPLLSPSFARPQTGQIVVVDPGHGGRSSGTRSIIDGRLEKEFTLDWALRLSRLLTQKGWQVVLTRTNDVDVPVLDRVAMADACRADVFVSLHFNAETTQTQSGVETYCLPPLGMASQLVRDGPDTPNVLYPNNAFDDENARLAMRVHHALVRGAGVADRGVRRARYPGVLRTQNRPSILVEGGYLSHRIEALAISRPEYRQKLAEAVASAFESRPR